MRNCKCCNEKLSRKTIYSISRDELLERGVVCPKCKTVNKCTDLSKKDIKHIRTAPFFISFLAIFLPVDLIGFLLIVMWVFVISKNAYIYFVEFEKEIIEENIA